MTPKIPIVDDHPIVRRGVRAMVADFRPEWEISGEAVLGRGTFLGAPLDPPLGMRLSFSGI